MRRVLLCALLYLPAPWLWAHGGGLDAQGCHHNRKTGDYHCHRSSSPSTAHAAPVPSLQVQAPRAGGVYYRNCSEARAAGVAPIRRGDAGYARHLDRDNDGVACE